MDLLLFMYILSYHKVRYSHIDNNIYLIKVYKLHDLIERNKISIVELSVHAEGEDNQHITVIIYAMVLQQL